MARRKQLLQEKGVLESHWPYRKAVQINPKLS